LKTELEIRSQKSQQQIQDLGQGNVQLVRELDGCKQQIQGLKQEVDKNVTKREVDVKKERGQKAEAKKSVEDLMRRMSDLEKNQKAALQYLERKLDEEESARKILERKLDEEQLARKGLERKLDEEESEREGLQRKLNEEELARKVLERKLDEEELARKVLERKLDEEQLARKTLEGTVDEEQSARKRGEESARKGDEELARKGLQRKLDNAEEEIRKLRNTVITQARQIQSLGMEFAALQTALSRAVLHDVCPFSIDILLSPHICSLGSSPAPSIIPPCSSR
jgi:chromosome segregation ATPase